MFGRKRVSKRRDSKTQRSDNCAGGEGGGTVATEPTRRDAAKVAQLAVNLETCKAVASEWQQETYAKHPETMTTLDVYRMRNALLETLACYKEMAGLAQRLNDKCP